MSNTVTIYGQKDAVDIQSLVDKINAVIKEMNNDYTHARLIATLPEKKRNTIRDILIAQDAMKGYLHRCEVLQKENLELKKRFNAISRINIFKRKPIYEQIDSNTRELLQNLQYYMNAKTQLEALEGSLHNIDSLILDSKPSEDYVKGYLYLAEHEYNPFVYQLNKISGSNIPFADLDAEIVELEPIKVETKINQDLEDDYASDDENSN